jgi:hypothetical protein
MSNVKSQCTPFEPHAVKNKLISAPGMWSVGIGSWSWPCVDEWWRFFRPRRNAQVGTWRLAEASCVFEKRLPVGNNQTHWRHWPQKKVKGHRFDAASAGNVLVAATACKASWCFPSSSVQTRKACTDVGVIAHASCFTTSP